MLACILLYNLLWLGIARPAAAWNQGDPGGNFTIINGQIFTPGLAIVDAVSLFQPRLSLIYQYKYRANPLTVASAFHASRWRLLSTGT